MNEKIELTEREVCIHVDKIAVVFDFENVSLLYKHDKSMLVL